jgi:Flp pilus assembly protein TadD
MVISSALLGLYLIIVPADSEQIDRKGEHQVHLEQQRASVLMRDTSIADFANGIDLVGNGSYEEAVRVFKKSTAEYPKNSRAYFNLGVIYKYLRKYECAGIVLRKGYELEKDPRYKEEMQEVNNLQIGREKTRKP